MDEILKELVLGNKGFANLWELLENVLKQHEKSLQTKVFIARTDFLNLSLINHLGDLLNELLRRENVVKLPVDFCLQEYFINNLKILLGLLKFLNLKRIIQAVIEEEFHEEE